MGTEQDATDRPDWAAVVAVETFDLSGQPEGFGVCLSFTRRHSTEPVTVHLTRWQIAKLRDSLTDALAESHLNRIARQRMLERLREDAARDAELNHDGRQG